jgi:hypothetical protein
MNEPKPQLPEVSDLLLSTTASLVNLAGLRLTEEEYKNVPKAKDAIDAARGLLPLCPKDQIGPIQDALSQLQMIYVKEAGTGAHPAEPGASATADKGAEARSQIWTPPGT